MFLGHHALRLDDKGRLFLPAKYRDELAGGVVITKGQERCLCVYTRTDFLARAAALQATPMQARQARDYSRVLFGSASDEIPDRQGRVTLPAGLRAYAGLTHECSVVGNNSVLEIWDSATWADYEASREQDFSDLPEAVVGGVL